MYFLHELLAHAFKLVLFLGQLNVGLLQLLLLLLHTREHLLPLLQLLLGEVDASEQLAVVVLEGLEVFSERPNPEVVLGYDFQVPFLLLLVGLAGGLRLLEVLLGLEGQLQVLDPLCIVFLLGVLVFDLQLPQPDLLQQLAVARLVLMLQSRNPLLVGELLELVVLLPHRDGLPQQITLLLQPPLLLKQVLHQHRVDVAVPRSNYLLQLRRLLQRLLFLKLQFHLSAGVFGLAHLTAERQLLQVSLQLGYFAVLVLYDVLEAFDDAQSVPVLVLEAPPLELFVAVLGLHLIEGLSGLLCQQPVPARLALQLRELALLRLLAERALAEAGLDPALEFGNLLLEDSGLAVGLLELEARLLVPAPPLLAAVPLQLDPARQLLPLALQVLVGLQRLRQRLLQLAVHSPQTGNRAVAGRDVRLQRVVEGLACLQLQFQLLHFGEIGLGPQLHLAEHCQLLLHLEAERVDFCEEVGVGAACLLLLEQAARDVCHLIAQLADQPLVFLERAAVLLPEALVPARLAVQMGFRGLELRCQLRLLHLPLLYQPLAAPPLNPALRVARQAVAHFLLEPGRHFPQVLQLVGAVGEVVLEGRLLLAQLRIFLLVVGGLVLEVGEFVELELEVSEQLVVLDLELAVEPVQVADLALEQQPQRHLLREGPLLLLLALPEQLAVELQLLVLGPELAVLAVNALVLLAVHLRAVLDQRLLPLHLLPQRLLLRLALPLHLRHDRLNGAAGTVFHQDAEHLPQVLLHALPARLADEAIEAHRIHVEAFEYPRNALL